MEIFGVTLTIAQVFQLIGQLYSILNTAAAVYRTLKGKGVDPADTFSILGKAIAGSAANIAGVPHPHPMTAQETDLWFAHAQGSL